MRVLAVLFLFIAAPLGAQTDWQAPTGYGFSTQGGFVGAPVTAESGKTTSVIVTR